jgi:Cysteine-rich secretory protein family
MRMMRVSRIFLSGTMLVGLAGGSLWAQPGFAGASQPAMAEQLFALANQTRAQAGLGKLTWDAALAEAAMRHCQRMAGEGQISHRYGGEQSLTERAATAGAHFSLIEENIAVGSHPEQIHQAWMQSPGHRANLLNAQINRVGIAVVAAQGVLFAVSDYSAAVAVLTATQVEGRVAGLIEMSGMKVLKDPHDARLACPLDHGVPSGLYGGEPGFIMRWQGADLEHLPQALVNKLGTREYAQADVGACPAQSDQGTFTVYRVAVLLYPTADTRPQPYYRPEQ